MVPVEQLGKLTMGQLEQLGYWDNVKVTTVGGEVDEAKKQTAFAAGVADAIPEKRVISFNVTTLAKVNLFRDVKDVYPPKVRFLPTVKENFVTPPQLDVHIGFFLGHTGPG